METIFEDDSFTICKYESLDDLGNEWEKLQKNASLYLSFQSVKSYVKNVVGKNILIFVLKTDEGVIKSILPFRYSDFGLNRLYHLICYNFGFDLEPVGDLDENTMERFLGNVFRYIVKGRSIVLLDNVGKEFSGHLKIMSSSMNMSSKKTVSKEHLYKLILKNKWEDFLSTLGSKFRKNLKYYYKKLGDGFKIVFYKSDNSEDIKLFFKLHKSSMESKNDLSLLEFENFQKYYTDMLSAFGKNAGLFNLKLDDNVVASLMYIDLDDTRYFLNIGLLPEYKKYSVGRILISHAIEEAIKMGLKYFDFGRGDSPYKLDWGCDVYENYSVTIYSSGLYYSLFKLYSFIYDSAKRIAINLLKITFIKNIILRKL
ncbi:MAG: GNAT family N-acetyltransferase [Candidatus Aenigmarchaeota archaeon]|nr:GNAT family N-acetyltransferase [Candidatus Aenigmarchaeota archaeon]